MNKIRFLNKFNFWKRKKNKLRSGLSASKKLKKGFYEFVYEKHIDWAIILGSVFVLLPYVASKNLSFLIVKSFLLLYIIYLILRYLISWKQLQSYYKEKEKFDQAMKKIINPDKTHETSSFLKKLTSEIEELTKKAEKKSDLYTSFQEYCLHEKEDIASLEELINKDKSTTLTAIGEAVTIITTIEIIRTIPLIEKKNYNRLLLVIFLTFAFFILYYFEYWFT